MQASWPDAATADCLLTTMLAGSGDLGGLMDGDIFGGPIGGGSGSFMPQQHAAPYRCVSACPVCPQHCATNAWHAVQNKQTLQCLE